MPKFENVYIFVVDALRQDYLPSSVRDAGVSINTISSSTISPTSFASIASGLHPQEHGVKTFFHTINPNTSILNLNEYNTSFWQIILNGGVDQTLGQDSQERVAPEDIKPPFVYIERDLSTHAPYNEWTTADFEASDNPRTIWGDRIKDSMWDRFSGDWRTIRRKYQSGAETAAERFFDRIDMLESRDLLKNTLVIFTSDHGELLGEYGEKSHSTPVVSELVRVPTVLFSANVDIESQINRSLMSHVDIVATIEDVLQIDLPWNVSGKSIFSSGTDWGYNEYHIPQESTETKKIAPRHRQYEERVRSVWDMTGGHVFKHISQPEELNLQSRLFGPPNYESEISRLRYLLLMVGRHLPVVGSSWAKLRTVTEAVSYHKDQHVQIGNPKMSLSEVTRLLDKLESEHAHNADIIRMSEEQLNHLEHLGYQ